MIADLLFGAYRKKALSCLFLHPDMDYHVRELARLTGTAPGTLHKELARLADAGLLLRKAQGNQVRYQANRRSPVFDELAGLMRKTTGAAELLGEAVAPLKPAVALIFGSIARGTETASSDVDVMLIADAAFAEVAKAVYPVQASLGREINPVIYNAAEFQRRVQAGDPFVREVLAQPKIFLIGSSDDLGELAGHPASSGL